MKQILSILSLLILTNFGASAQAWISDSVSMNTQLSENVYYQMSSNGAVKTESSTNWHIALSLSIGDSASVFANHGGGGTSNFTEVYNIHKPAADWNNITIADTANSQKLYNGLESWHQGAFNDNANPSPFHFGWGIYNQGNFNTIYGDSIFVVKAGPDYYKFMIDSLQSQTYTWHLRYQKLDLVSMTQVATVTRSPNYADRLFAYFNLDSGQELDREPAINDWDIVFATYAEEIFGGPPPQQLALYGVTGALSNKGILVTEVASMEVDAAFNDGLNQFWGAPSSVINTIGYDWKNPPMGPPPAAYTMQDSLSYFIKNKGDSIYQLQFLGFGGSSNGNINFRKRLLGKVTAVNDVNNQIEDYQLFPNPASNATKLVFTAKKAGAVNVVIYDLNGRAVMNTKNSAAAGLNAFNINTSNYSNGTYIIHVIMDDGYVKEKMTILR